MSTVAVRVFLGIIAGASARGVDKDALLRSSGIDPQTLETPDARLPFSAEIQLWKSAVDHTGDDDFGIHLAEQLQIADMGGLGFAVRNSSTMREALHRVSRFIRVLHSEVGFTVTENTNHAVLRFARPQTAPLEFRQPVDFLMTQVLLIGKRAASSSIHPTEVRFRHRDIAKKAEYYRVFGNQLKFESTHDEMVLGTEWLDMPLLNPEPQLSAILDQHLEHLSQQVPEKVSFADQVGKVIIEELRDGEPSVDRIAERLRMSPRTLQRKLQTDGLSVQSLLAQVREDLAKKYLTTSDETIEEIAFALGFSDVTTFFRAFKRWTGRTPASFRTKR